MALENADQIQELVDTNPEGSDPLSEADNHIRMLKLCLQTSLPGMTAPWTTTSKINCANPTDPQDVVTKSYLEAYSGFPVGHPLLWLAPTLPSADWIAFEGQLLSRTEYAALFALYGTAYGAGDNVSTFQMPDTRGLFPRFMDNGAGVDPDRASRTDRGDGTTGDNVGTRQADDFKSHQHVSYWEGFAVTSGGTPASKPYPSVSTAADAAAGGAETRPKNIYFRLICRAK